MLNARKGILAVKLKWLTLLFLSFFSASVFPEALETKVKDDKAESSDNTKDTRELVYLSAVDFANWIDSFFGEVEQLEDADFDYLRLRNDFIFKEGESPRYRPKIKAKVRLPQLSNKISLIFSNEKNNGKNEFDDGSEVQTVSNDANNTSAALNYESNTYSRSKFDSRIGLGSRLKLFAFTRQTFQVYQSETLTIKNYNYLIWRDEDGLGVATKINLSKVVTKDRLFRWDYAFLMAEKTRGNEWSTGVAIVDQLAEESWIAYQIGANGESELDWDVSEYRLSTRFRKQTEIPWLYFEIEPALSYVKSIEEPERHLVPSIRFRFEIKLEQ